ncbi:MAG: flippase-like domain-containing protein [Fibrobacterales bacterium]
MNNAIKKIIALIFILAPVVWLITEIDGYLFIEQIQTIAWWTIPVLFTAQIIAILIQGTRLWALLNAKLADITLSEIIKIHLASMYYSIILPSSSAIDVVRALFLSKKYHYQDVWGATWINKILILFVLLLLSFIGFANNQSISISTDITTLVIVSSILLSILTILSFSKKITGTVAPLISSLLPTKIYTIISNLRQGVYEYKNFKTGIFKSLFLTILMQFVSITGFSLTLYGVTGQFYYFEVLTFIPLIEIVTFILPLTPNGAGIRESLTLVFLNTIGLESTTSAIFITITFLAYITKFLSGISLILFKELRVGLYSSN